MAYPALRRGNLGFDWGTLITSGSNIVRSLVTGSPSGQASSVGTVAPTQSQMGMSIGTIVLLGVGGFLLYKAASKR
jgi:hypothetical protein